MLPVRLPKLSSSMQEGILVAWLKEKGDYIAQGDSLAQIETDKAVLELESPVSGTLVALRCDAGARVPVNTIVAFIEPTD